MKISLPFIINRYNVKEHIIESVCVNIRNGDFHRRKHPPEILFSALSDEKVQISKAKKEPRTSVPVWIMTGYRIGQHFHRRKHSQTESQLQRL